MSVYKRYAVTSSGDFRHNGVLYLTVKNGSKNFKRLFFRFFFFTAYEGDKVINNVE